LGRQAVHPAFEKKSADRILMRARFCPDHEYVGNRTIGDPGFGAGEPVALLGLFRFAAHRLRVGTRIWFGEAKAADPFSRGKPWQILAALSRAAIGIDCMHHERRLHTHHRTIAAIGALDLAGGKPAGDMAEPGAAILLRNRRTEQPNAAHPRHDLAIETLLEIIFGHRGNKYPCANARAESRTSFSSSLSWPSRSKGSSQAKVRVVSPPSAIGCSLLRSGQMPDRGRKGFSGPMSSVSGSNAISGRWRAQRARPDAQWAR
jgi:hypothetical protein